MAFEQTARAGAAFQRGTLWQTTALVAVSVALAAPGHGDTLFWDSGDTTNGALDPADGVWDDSTPLWATDTAGSGPTTFENRDQNGINEDPGDTAVFSDPGGATVDVTVATAITPERIEIEGNGYTFSGGGTFGNTFGTIGPSTITIDLSAGVLATITDVNLEGSFVVTGDGTLAYTGTATAVEDFAIEETAGFELSGDITANGFVDNFGTSTVAGSVTAPALRNRDIAGATMTITGSVTGDLVNRRDAFVQGEVTGEVENRGADAVLRVTGDLDAGTVINSEGADFTVQDGSTLDVTSDAAFENRDTSTLTINGTVADGVDNAAVLDLNDGPTTSGRIEGDLDNTGTASLAGVITGDLNNLPGADATVDGDLDVQGIIRNDAVLTVNNGDTLAASGGDLRNRDGGDLNVNGTVDGVVDNLGGAVLDVGNNGVITGNTLNDQGGSMTLAGTLQGELNNDSSADDGTGTGTGVTVDGDATVEGLVDNDGDITVSTSTLTLEGGIEQDGNLTVSSGAILDLSTALAAPDRDLTNNDTLTIQGTVVADDVINAATGTLTQTGQITSNLQNSGTAAIAGQIDGALTNAATGVVTITDDATIGLGVTNANTITLDGGNLTVTEDVTNTGTIRLDQGNLSVTQTVTNDGVVTIDNGEELRAGGLVTNRTGAEINANGLLGANVQNDAGATLDVGEFATIQGDIVNDGDTQLGGTVSGTVTNNATGGLTVDHDTTVTGILRNDGDMSVTAGDTLTAQSDVDNNADLLVNGTVIGDVANSGTVDIADGGEIDGTLTVTGLGSALIDGVLRGDLDNREVALVRNGGRITGDADNSDRLTVASGATLSGNLTNSGSTTIGGTVGGSATTLNNDAGSLTVEAGATINGALVNDSGASLTAEGGMFTGDVSNSAGGNFEVTSDTNVGGDFTNEGTLTGDTDDVLNLFVDGTFANTGTIINNGIAGTVGVFTITANLIVNDQTIDGSFALIGDLVNRDTINFTGDTNLGGALTNQGIITATATVDMDDNPLTNDTGGDLDIGVGGAFVTTGIVTNRADFDIADGGSLTGGAIINEDGGAMTSSGTINGPLTNEDGGTLVTTGTVNGDVTNDAGGTATVAGTVNGDLNNAGTLGIEGTVTGRFATTDGTATLTGDFSAGDVSNAGTLVVGLGNTLQSASGIENEDGGVISSSGVLDGNVTNREGGTLGSRGGITGNLTNRGDANLRGTVDGTITNRGTGVLETTGDLETAGLLNEGTATIALGHVLDTTVVSTGTLTVDGTLLGDLASEGTTAINGTVDGNMTSLDDTELAGTVTGDLMVTGGIVEVTADSSVGGDVTNDAAPFLITDGQTLTVGGTFDNQTLGELYVEGVLDGDLNNAGLAEFDGSFGGMLNNTGTASIAGDATGTVTNDGAAAELSVAGNLAVGLTNSGGASATVGSITGDLSNVGDVTVATGVTGNVSSDGSVDITGNVGGTVTSNGDLTMVGDIEGGLRHTGTGAVTGDVGGNVLNQASSTLNLTGNVGGSVTNLSALTLTGDISDGLSSSGTLNMSGNVEDAATITAGTATIDGDVRFGLTNDGVTVVTGDVGAGTGGAVTNGAAGVLTIGGAISGDVANSGDLSLGGNLTGNLVNTGGDVAFGGDVIGDVTSTGAGMISLSGGVRITGTFSTDSDLEVAAGETFTLGGYENNGGNAVIDGMLAAASSVNSGTMTFGNAGVADGDLRNTTSGVLQMVNGARITGDLINNGSFLLSVPEPAAGDAFELPNVAGETVTVQGGLDGAGSFTLDVDLSDSTGDSSGQGDTVVFLGAATGDFIINLNVIDPTSLGEQENDVLLIDVDDSLGSANDFTIREVNGLPVAEQFVYVLTRTNGGPNGTGDLLLADSVNPAFGALAGNIALTQSLIGSVVNRPTSPFVVGLGVDDGRPCGLGGWARASGGAAIASGTTRTEAGVSSESEIDATYYGVQFGGDFACFQGHFSGWDMAFGAIGGINQGSTDQPVFAIDPNTGFATGAQLSTTTADFQQIYGGVYMTATRGPLALDLQLRQEESSFTLNNTSVGGGAGLGLNDTEFDSSTTTLSGAASYAFALENGWAITPTAGFAYSKSSTDTIVFDDGATLEIADSDRQIGFVGGTVSKSTVGTDGRSLLSYFATGTYYQDFADPVATTYTPFGGVGEQSESDNLGAYGEVSFGVSYIKILSPKQGSRAPRQFSASARADARFSSTLSGASISAQARWQF